MASKTFLLLALAFAVLLLITSEVAAANELASEHDSVLDGHKYYGGGRKGYGKGYGKRKGCKYGCCGRGYYYKGCKCCSTAAEATAYKQQTQN